MDELYLGAPAALCAIPLLAAALRTLRTRARARRVRAAFGTPTNATAASGGHEVTVKGVLRVDGGRAGGDGRVTTSFPRSVAGTDVPVPNASTTPHGALTLESGHAVVRLDGPVQVLVGLDEEGGGADRSLKAGATVVARGRLDVEPRHEHAEGYRDAAASLRLLAPADRDWPARPVTIAATASPRDRVATRTALLAILGILACGGALAAGRHRDAAARARVDACPAIASALRTHVVPTDADRALCGDREVDGRAAWAEGDFARASDAFDDASPPSVTHVEAHLLANRPDRALAAMRALRASWYPGNAKLAGLDAFDCVEKEIAWRIGHEPELSPERRITEALSTFPHGRVPRACARILAARTPSRRIREELLAEPRDYDALAAYDRFLLAEVGATRGMLFGRATRYGREPEISGMEAPQHALRDPRHWLKGMPLALEAELLGRAGIDGDPVYERRLHADWAAHLALVRAYLGLPTADDDAVVDAYDGWLAPGYGRLCPEGKEPPREGVPCEESYGGTPTEWILEVRIHETFLMAAAAAVYEGQHERAQRYVDRFEKPVWGEPGAREGRHAETAEWLRLADDLTDRRGTLPVELPGEWTPGERDLLLVAGTGDGEALARYLGSPGHAIMPILPYAAPRVIRGQDALRLWVASRSPETCWTCGVHDLVENAAELARALRAAGDAAGADRPARLAREVGPRLFDRDLMMVVDELEELEDASLGRPVH